MGSPLSVVGVRGRFATKTAHSTTDDPSDLVLFRALVSEGRLDSATTLCRERLLTSEGERLRVRWVKDLAIVTRVAGDYEAAYDLHLTIHTAAQRFDGAFRGRIEHGFARSLQTLGHFDPAFEHYTAARYFYEQGNEPILAAGADTNTGRCYVSAGHPENSHLYFDRALEVARNASDSHLEGEIHESIALALEAEGKYAEGEAEALLSVQLVSATGDRTALDESVRTWQRLKARLTEGAR